MPHLARKRMTVLGGTYAAGDPVPFDDLPLKTKRFLIEQRRVIYEAEKPRELQAKGKAPVLESKGEAETLRPKAPKPPMKRKRTTNKEK